MYEASPDGNTAESQSAQPVLCPQCGEPVDWPAISGPVASCPKCGTQFFAPDAEEESHENEIENESTHGSQEEELSALRIKQMSALRRTAYRTRSYFIIGAITCGALAVNLVYYAVDEIRRRHHFTVYVGLYICLALAAFLGAWKFWSRAVDTHRTIQASIKARELEGLEISKQERDFSALSDGSHQARNLEQVFDPDQNRSE